SSKYLILSATASSEIYKELFKNEIEIIDLPQPQMKANILQYTSFNLTKHSLEEKRSEAMLKLHEYSENDYKTISFKELEPDAHFYSLSSNNNLSGENLVIIGTPNPNLNRFKLLLHTVGFENPEIKPYNELNYEEDTYRNRRIYYFKVSNDQKINEIYYSMIESELVQAIGRTRPFEHESKVVIFSNFILPDYAKTW
ncbi:hypothetical protein, partial [Leptospira idonii]|uniref:hypothetical protein n=1 Tax=Leptospira idonii TaxID=1193500 RepID=UPI00143828A8